MKADETHDAVESFRIGIDSRNEELDYLHDGLVNGLVVVTDHDALNATIIESARPELVLTDQVEQMEISWPFNQRRLNNFTPNMSGFGARVYMDVQEPWEKEPQNKFVGLRQLTQEERDLYFFMGARGDYEQHHAFANANGVDESIANDMMMLSLLPEAAFMRMWIALPELTEYLMSKCLNEYTPTPITAHHTEEIYVAYSVMSKLVDAKDAYVLRSNGKLDDWKLCR